jgi:peptidoglycan/LPS O-acetylase OafA/YrhL
MRAPAKAFFDSATPPLIVVHQSRPDGTKGVFDLLDALRGLAALVVVWAHLGAWTAPYRPLLAGVSVDLFFAISGFVIAHSSEDRLANG